MAELILPSEYLSDLIITKVFRWQDSLCCCSFFFAWLFLKCCTYYKWPDFIEEEVNKPVKSCKDAAVLFFSTSMGKKGIMLYLRCDFLKTRQHGAPLSSVGSACDPCAEALQWSWVRLPAWVPLLRVTPPLLPCFLSHSSAVLSIKPQKTKKI